MAHELELRPDATTAPETTVPPGTVVTGSGWPTQHASPAGVVLGPPSETNEYVVALCTAPEEATGEAIQVDQTEITPLGPHGEVGRPLAVQFQKTLTLTGGEIGRPIARLAPEAVARILRARISADTRWFYEAVHAPRTAPASPSGVPYAGRVFDHRELQHAVDASLDFWLTLGPYGDRFRKALAAYLGVRKSILVNSGSSANLLAVAALTSPLLGERRLRPGDEVITTAGGFPSTMNPILQNGCTAVLVDSRADSGNLDVDSLEEAVGPRTRAIVLAHTLGNPFDVEAVKRVCDQHGLWLIEDNCDALGSTYRSAPTGTFGDLSTQSFYPSHHLTMGEGGAVNVVSDGLFVRILESLRDWGRDCWCEAGMDNLCGKRFGWELGDLPAGYDHKFIYSHVGYNLKPTDWQAAIGCAQIEKLPRFVQARRHNWQLLRDVFTDFEEFFELPCAAEGTEPSWFGFKVLLRPSVPFTRDELVAFLEAEAIQTRMVFGGNLARQPAYMELRRGDESSPLRVVGSMAGADRLMTSAFFLGVYPGLTETHVGRVADALRSFFRRLS